MLQVVHTLDYFTQSLTFAQNMKCPQCIMNSPSQIYVAKNSSFPPFHVSDSAVPSYSAGFAGNY